MPPGMSVAVNAACATPVVPVGFRSMGGPNSAPSTSTCALPVGVAHGPLKEQTLSVGAETDTSTVIGSPAFARPAFCGPLPMCQLVVTADVPCTTLTVLTAGALPYPA